MYRSLIRPCLFQIDPELVHHVVAMGVGNVLSRPLLWGHQLLMDREFPQLKTSFCGIPCEHPIGLAAGFDKDATMFHQLHLLGFSHVEIGTVTGKGQPGNPKKRLFRLPEDKGLINRMGFNNRGAEAAAKRLALRTCQVPLGGNIGKTKLAGLGDEAILDYEKSFLALKPHVAYMVVNVSSPNTPGLRSLQDKEPLMTLLSHLSELNRIDGIPILLKIAPDLTESQLEEIVEVVTELKLPGVIATNTTLSRDGLKTTAAKVEQIGAGGLSGRPVFDMSTKVLRFLRQRLPQEVDLIGVGGIFSGQDVYEKVKAGANAVQIYTGFIYNGPACIFNMKRELAALLKRDGVERMGDIIGIESHL